jgi:hypothetical protein
MTIETRTAKLNNLLDQCDQLFTHLVQIIPDLQTGDLDSLSKDEKSDAATLCAFLIQNMEEVKGLLRKANLDGVPPGITTSKYAIYQDQLIVNRNAIVTIAIALFDIEKDPRRIPPEERNTPIWNILVSGLDYWSQDESGTFSHADCQAADDLIYSPFFEPDQWLKNEQDLKPVLGSSPNQRIPQNVRIRLREVFRSFILGNHLSVIALSRAILEYALIDRASNIGIDPSNPGHTNRTKSISWLVEDTAEKKPHLKDRMELIVDIGNKTLHAKKRDQLAFLPITLRDYALTSIDAIRSIIEELYLPS